MLGYKLKRTLWNNFTRKPSVKDEKAGMFQPSVYHALIIIFLEFFSWGLLMNPIITVLDETFGSNAFLMNGLIQGVKGLLSFLAAPLIGAMSDVWGRKPFLLLTVTFTCAPIPLMKFSPMWYFAITSLSGMFAVTFSIVFAYVADVTTKEERSAAYGLVSATFAASLVTSPAIGAYLGAMYGDNLVIALASAVALLDVFFIMAAVPESMSDKRELEVHISKLSWEKADPFGSLRKIGKDYLILMLCVTVFLSYLPEAGEYSSFFVYLRLVMGFTQETVAAYVAMIGILSCVAQTAFLAILMKHFGNKHAVIVGLGFEMLQLFMIGFGSQHWILWTAGAIAAMGSITYPAISVFVSAHASPDQQGVAQGVITGIRGLCNGLGPALYGFIFYLFHVDLTTTDMSGTPHSAASVASGNATTTSPTMWHVTRESIAPGPPFVFGGVLVIVAMLVAMFMPVSSTLIIQSDISLTGGEPVQLEAATSSGSLVTRVCEKEPLVLSEEDSV